MAYTQAFEIPVNKDWVFRSKKSQQELLENTPGVERIHVADRSTARPTTAGYDVVKVTIRGTSEQVVKELFEEGRQKILASLAYDAEKAEKKRVHKHRGRSPIPRDTANDGLKRAFVIATLFRVRCDASTMYIRRAVVGGGAH